MARNNTSLTTWNIQHVNTPSRFAQYWLQIWLPKLPPETREAIFRGLLVEQVYDVYWYGEPIPFIEELRRSHDGMYEEAWDLLLRRQTLRLWLGNINMALKEDFRSIAAGVQRLELSVSSLSIKYVRQVFSGGASFKNVNLTFSSTLEKLEDTLLPWIFLMLELSPQLRTLSLTWPSFITEDQWPQLPEYYHTYLPAYEYARHNRLPVPNPPYNLLQHIQHALSNTSAGAIYRKKLLPSRPSWSYWTVFNTNASRFPNRPYPEQDYEVTSHTWKAKVGKVLVWNLDEDSE